MFQRVAVCYDMLQYVAVPTLSRRCRPAPWHLQVRRIDLQSSKKRKIKKNKQKKERKYERKKERKKERLKETSRAYAASSRLYFKR